MKSRFIKKFRFLKFALHLFVCVTASTITGIASSAQSEIVGEFFGKPIPRENYNFVFRTVIIFGAPWGGVPQNEKQLEKRIWDDLILSFEAHRRNIIVSESELEEEIGNVLKDNKAEFDWHTDKEAYRQWSMDTLKEPVELFEGQIRHLLQLKKLHRQIIDSIKPTVTAEEAHQEFLNEHNTLSVELFEIETEEEAQKIFRQIQKKPSLWEKMKEKDPKKFRQPGFVSLEFLMAMWKIPEDAVYDMIKMKAGSFYRPAPIYKNYGVFKILQIRLAEEENFDKRRQSYFDQITAKKKIEGFNNWLAQLHKDAQEKRLVKVPEGIFK